MSTPTAQRDLAAAIAALCLLLSPTFLLAQADPFAGVFTDEQITLELKPTDDGHRGEIRMGERRFPASARRDGERLSGSFESEGNQFAFTVSRQGANVVFETGSRRFNLHPSAPQTAPRTAPPSAPRTEIDDQADLDRMAEASRLYSDRDYEAAIRIYLPLAEKGRGDAQYMVGLMHQHGRGVPQDLTKAAEWYAKASDQGISEAQNNLGVLYRDGRGVQKDPGKAFELFRKAALQRNADACLSVGAALVNGVGVARDLVDAYGWYVACVELGDPDIARSARSNMQILTQHMTPEQIDAAKLRGQAILRQMNQAEQRGGTRNGGGARDGDARTDDIAGGWVPLSRRETRSNPTPPTAPARSYLRLRPVVITDPGVDQIEAARFLVPAEWRSDARVWWRHDRSILATLVGTVTAPDGIDQFCFLPTEAYVQGRFFGFGPGDNYLGNEVQPAMGAEDLLKRLVLPRYRRDIVNPRFVHHVGMGEITRLLQTGGDGLYHAGRVRVEYALNDRAVEEDFYYVLKFFPVQSPQGPVTFWSSERLLSFRAEKGQLDLKAKLFLTIANSLRVELRWHNAYQQVHAMWERNVMESIRQAGLLSRYIAQVNAEITANRRAVWENAQASQDRVHRRFAEYTRGTETYNNPVTGQPVELPGGYQNAWANASGEYVVSDSASFNPNVGSTITWEPMAKVD